MNIEQIKKKIEFLFIRIQRLEKKSDNCVNYLLKCKYSEQIRNLKSLGAVL